MAKTNIKDDVPSGAKIDIPSFLPEQYFDGQLTAFGLFIDRFGTVQRQFRVTIDGRRTDDGFILDEYFVYDDGEFETRQWTVTALEGGVYRGECADVVGHAKGVLTNNVLSWRYKFNLPMFGCKVTVTFDDVMALQDGAILVNRAKVLKWGFLLGEVLISFRPVS
ncbi:DUF3833 family protein [Candidatus Puniceispirillum sp.]|uniref:DUF3833 family protein n=1 Tax=Candidatus Puniceispirillum sp. TaxID=2026719 RepID=UPI001EB50FF8|nr:DUF3833 family protein [Candidatus Puniceispirillum sp.]